MFKNVSSSVYLKYKVQLETGEIVQEIVCKCLRDKRYERTDIRKRKQTKRKMLMEKYAFICVRKERHLNLYISNICLDFGFLALCAAIYFDDFYFILTFRNNKIKLNGNGQS